MKKVAFIFIILIIWIPGVRAQSNPLKTLIGRWEVTGDQNSGCGLEILDTSTIVLTYMGEKRKVLNYKFDFSRTPIWFDFSVQDSAGVMAVKTLLEPVNESVIRWQLFVDEERPNHFSSTKGELFYLRKSKSATQPVVSNSN